jgi:uncharacterized protein YbbK (DUF523 family)
MSSTKKVQTAYLIPEKDCRGYCEPVLVSACFLGIPCRWHGRRAKRRDALLARLKKKYVLVPVCPEQLGGMPTPRSGEYLRGGTGADVLDGQLRIVDSATGQDLTDFHVSGSRYALEIAEIVGARRAFLKSGSPCCDRDGVTGELLRRAGIEVVRVP